MAESERPSQGMLASNAFAQAWVGKESQLPSSQIQLQQFENLLAESQERIAAMESSKFWKLREAWMEVKSKSGLGAGD